MTDSIDLAPDLMPDGLPRPNLPLLRKVLDHIDAHPEEHDQVTWGFEYRWPSAQFLIEEHLRAGKCGTAMCIAGWAVSLGAPQTFDGNWGEEDARAVLGLTPRESADLFAADNTRGAIQGCVERIAARAGEQL